jgi:hypothetical protein
LNALIEREEKTPAFDYYHFREVRTAGSEPDEQAPLAFNLFGDTGDPESLVASENDLLDFLVRVLSRNPPLQSNLTSLLSAEQGRKFTFLFLGMGFQQWHIRILLHALGMLRHKQPSLAVEDARFFEHPDRPATALFFEQQHKIAFRQISVSDFAAELRRRYERLTGNEPDEEEITVAEGAPKVFLCYRGDDRDEVIAWRNKLHRHGIATWHDRQDLRGGDNWNQLIRDVLDRQCDYVLVMQTRAMVSTVRTYCNREIAIALDIQQEYGAFKFVIPIRLDDCAGFDNLRHLQTQDLRTDADLDRLVRTIRADWQLRREQETA